ncbi:MAG: Y-family DNA polymerase [Janthinobacterium lividum]
MRRVVSLWLPFWPIERLRRPGSAPPDDGPLVTRAHDRGRSVIAAACPQARALGLRAGMALAHAQAMVPGLAVADARVHEDARALERLAAWCLRLSPLTAADPPDGLWIDATGCGHLHGGERPLLDTLVAQLARQGLTGRVAIADTPGAAHALARFGEGSPTLVAPGRAAHALSPLPVAALRIEAAAADGLRRLGLERVGQLDAAPRGPLARRFGPGLLLRLDQAMGRVPEPVQPVVPPDAIVVRRGFVEPIATAESFAAVIAVLVEEACALLAARGEGARRLDLVFERVDATLQVVRVGTARPVRDAAHLGRLLRERIAEVDPGPGVEAMRLVLPLAEPLHPAQHDGGLVADAPGEPDLSALVDRLSNRLGAGSVYRLLPVQSDVPERSQRPVAFDTPGAGAAAWVSPWPRPVRLLARPEPVAALGALPDHPPRAFTWRRVRHLVRHADGPERIAGEWWRRDGEVAALRDYWTVENEAGRRFWLFRQGDGVDPATGALSWFLHGFF